METETDIGRALAEAGGNAALDHADREEPGWSDQAEAHFTAFLAGPGYDKPFMAEHVRAWAQKRGLAEPPDARAWGPILMRAARNGIIVKHGYGPAGNRTAHASPTTIWKRATA